MPERTHLSTNAILRAVRCYSQRYFGLESHANGKPSFGASFQSFVDIQRDSHQEISSMTAKDGLKGADNWQWSFNRQKRSQILIFMNKLKCAQISGCILNIEQ